MARRVIDLSQPLSRESQLHPFFPPTQILRHILHADAAEGRPSFNAEIIITSNHAATHVDAFGHYDKTGEAIAEMPLETFCGDALCVDIREYPRGHDVTAAEAQRAVEAGGQELRGVETISPDLVYLTDEYPTHKACAERRVTHFENLNNLKGVVGRRFQFFGFPLRLETAYGSPVRAVGIVDD